MSKNQAAWITEPKGKPLKVSEAPDPKPGAGEVVIKNAAIAINPVDWKIQKAGLFIKQYPSILGTDVAGTIEEVGEGVDRLKKGQRVIGHMVSLSTGDTASAAFQLYSKTFEILVSPIPDSLSFEEATVLPLAISTASAGLYQKTHLALPYPSTNPQPTGQTLLVWGGSSSVGATAIQLAAASGLKVVATASSKNHDFVKSLGAAAVIDYNSSNVVDEILAAIEQQGGKFAGAYDAISEPGSLKHIGAVTDKLGPSPVAVVLPPPEGLTKTSEHKHVFAISIALQHKEVGDAVWRKFIPEALASGQFKAKPDPLVVGKGLEKVQEGLDKQQAGVSAKKVVISL
ncbi:Alcohol dehydrogenase superfamily zinc-containing [Macrophomina phaseolina MS6]|uniref:Alcohol dehydrogenase superfamily zinc-containing n=2 Tax=Macrophomina phaseolina TaxID=35725 RepID=K2R950_MACPH|nr:Alcohol dehydrogenase superfamily zinc-containing [Macrophomina phaseolina MS6]KAH7061198.1 chaperonin 10-like protein [Macrophomina phaseolina]